MGHDKELRGQRYPEGLCGSQAEEVAARDRREDGDEAGYDRCCDPHRETLRTPPGNRLEKLKGNREGQWSIRINQQYRVCFSFEGGDAYDVEITDYH